MAKYSGYAAVLQTTISATLTDIGGIRDISGPSLSLNAIDVSSRDSPWMQFVAGMRDGGEITFDLIYDPDLTTHTAATAGGLVKDLMDGTLQAFKIKFADTTPATVTFSALVTKVTPKAPFNGAQTADVTLKISGLPTWG